jgi:hypothetical protein
MVWQTGRVEIRHSWFTAAWPDSNSDRTTTEPRKNYFDADARRYAR